MYEICHYLGMIVLSWFVLVVHCANSGPIRTECEQMTEWNPYRVPEFWTQVCQFNTNFELLIDGNYSWGNFTGVLSCESFTEDGVNLLHSCGLHLEEALRMQSSPVCVGGHFMLSCTRLKLWAEVSMFPLLSNLTTFSHLPFYYTRVESFMYCCDLSVNPNRSQNNYHENRENDI